MICEHLAEGCKVAGTVWHGAVPPEKFISRARLYVVEFAIPREMTQAQGIELARDFAQAEFVDQGMIADLNVHWDIGEDGMPKPHAHVM